MALERLLNQGLAKVRAPYKKSVWFDNCWQLVQFKEPGNTLVSLLEYVRPLVKD